MKTDHFDGLYWYNSENNETNFDDYTNHYNVPKIHNQLLESVIVGFYRSY